MTNVLFIFNVKDKWSVLHNLILKNLQKKRTTLVFCSNKKEGDALSEYFWNNSPSNFLAHQVNQVCMNEMICIASEKVDWMDDTLINSTDSMVNGFNRYLKLVELVTEDEAAKIKARERYKFYKDCGYRLSSMDVSNINF
ncbi:MAG: DNA polymerase III subunit chi [Methylophilales bacterium]|nr:DNA polymerase III subunit chi [Pseudomonadota bacterium]NQW35110.1 DNA polymerase III subunit chi [Methylophilales bacterium]